MKRIAFAAAIAAFLSPAAWCGAYTFTQVSPAGQNVDINYGAAINTSGEVVWINGVSAEAWNGTTLSSYPIGGTYDISAGNIGLSDAGGISFSYYNGSGFEGAVYSIPNGTLTNFGYPGETYNYAGGSSASGLVAGDYAGNTGWVWNGGSSFTTITYPGTHGQTYLNGVNNSGDVVGQNYCCDEGVSFLDKNGVFTTITVPGEANNGVLAQNLNNSDVVVGGAYNSQGNYDGFVWQNGVGSIVDYPGATDTMIYGINSSGELVGEADFGSYSDGIVFTATLGSGTPEPATFYLLIGAGLLIAGRKARRATRN